MRRPIKQAEFDTMFGQGISRSGSLIDIGTELSVITKSGAFYSYKGERLGQGRENVRKYLDAHPEIMNAIDAEIRGSGKADEVLTLGTAVED